MTFLSPWWLLLLVPVVALLAAYLVMHRRRNRYAVRFASLPLLDKVAPEKPGWRRHAPAAAFLVAMGLLGLAAARPEVNLRVPHERATIVVAVDVSRSMEATDVEPNRMEAARTAARSFIEGLPDSFNVGVVTFAGSTQVLSPPTQDHKAAAASLDSLTLADSTAIGEAVFTSLEQIASMAPDDAEGTDGGQGADGSGDPNGNGDNGSPGDGSGTEGDQPDAADRVPGRIVLLSDGTNTRGRDPGQAAEAATQAGVPVSTIAYGTDEGTVEINGQLVPVPVDVEALATLADATNGQAYTATSGEELESVYEDIGSSIGWRTEAREITPWLAAAAFLLLLGAGAMSLRWFSRLP
ncbi:Ca-activated chloride channel family protein [Knoellia remsis]|uniref:Ca-activated chloride channel family protein n=1 Tax=Knoellia remsis TaxID=407159 RepID=A0A2T0U858_9MICO|nr:VWA domain-containing protein [Knoellia remsis]PRY54103.1 Ca-activated chloride channel family protein [Knoellia remsis]